MAKIERNQSNDGSWNIAGGWAPVLGTSLASQSLYLASKKGVKVKKDVMDRADAYTVNNQKAQNSAVSGSETVAVVGSGTVAATTETARRQLTQGNCNFRRPPGGRRSRSVSECAGSGATQPHGRVRTKNAKEISAINGKLSDSRFVEGYGSIGGEEFFSYLNISDGLKRSGGKEWSEWNSNITTKILKLQNSDGTWAGHHCITGRVAVTSAAILNLTA